MTGHELLFLFIKKLKERSNQWKIKTQEAQDKGEMVQIVHRLRADILDEIIACYEELQKEGVTP